VEEFVRTRIAGWLPQSVIQLGERIVRVEEELKHQREATPCVRIVVASLLQPRPWGVPPRRGFGAERMMGNEQRIQQLVQGEDGRQDERAPSAQRRLAVG